MDPFAEMFQPLVDNAGLLLQYLGLAGAALFGFAASFIFLRLALQLGIDALRNVLAAFRGSSS